MATVELPIKVNVQVDPQVVQDVVNQHADRLMQLGRVEAVRVVLKALKHEDAVKQNGVVDNLVRLALAEEFGLSFLQEVLMDQLVDDAKPVDDNYCPQCLSEDERIVLQGCRVGGVDTTHKWHDEKDYEAADDGPRCSQCGSQHVGTREQIQTPGHPLYGRACENVHFHGPEEEW